MTKIHKISAFCWIWCIVLSMNTLAIRWSLTDCGSVHIRFVPFLHFSLSALYRVLYLRSGNVALAEAVEVSYTPTNTCSIIYPIKRVAEEKLCSSVLKHCYFLQITYNWYSNFGIFALCLRHCDFNAWYILSKLCRKECCNCKKNRNSVAIPII